MWEWVRLYLTWVNRQPRELRLMLKSGVWVMGVLAFVVLVVPILGGIFSLLTGGGLTGFVFAWTATLGVVAVALVPILLILGLPWLLLLLPALIIGVSLGPLALLRWVMGFAFPVMQTVKDWGAFKGEFTRMLGTDPAKQPERTEQGSARFALPDEVAAMPGGAIGLGQISSRSFTWDTPKHVLILASSRSGKGRSLLIPNLLTYSGGVVVIDPKGENAQLTARRRRQLNGDGRVFVLDPWGVSGEPTASFNPFDRLSDPDQLATEAAALASALIIGESDHWTGRLNIRVKTGHKDQTRPPSIRTALE